MEPLFIDFETRSPVDLKKAGLMRYARHEQTEALCMGWAFGQETPALWQQGQPLPDRVRLHVEQGGLVVAHNAQFELAIWNYVCRKLGWPPLRIEQVRDTMAACYAMSLPGALENAAHSIGLKVSKDAEGRALMLKMCKPRDIVDGVPIYHDSPEMRARLGAYCNQDVIVERDIYYRVYALSDKEQRLWILDQHINLRGIPFDLPSLESAITIADIEKERLNKEMGVVTEGQVTACSNVGSLKEWAGDFGVMPDSLTKADVNELLGEEYLPEPVEAALKLRQSAGRFTSISKLNAIQRREMNWRVHYALQYHAATTGRWAGRGIQPHNFTRDLPEPHEVEDVLAALRRKDATWISMAYDEPSIMISKCLRGFMHAGPGKVLLGGDFSNVEGRGLCWLAGEEWKLQAYRDFDTIIGVDAKGEPIRLGPDLYKVAYAKTFNIPIEAVTKDNRQIGKVEELAFGYQGGVGAFRTMGKTYKILVVAKITPEIVKRRKGYLLITEQQADQFKNGWRDGHPAIKSYWYALEKAAIDATRNPGVITHAGAAGREVSFRKMGSFLWCRLPSGRNLCYPYPVVIDDGYRGKLTFKSVPDATVWAIYAGQRERGEENTTYIIDPIGKESHSREWCRVSTYGGKLSENITQAICRDILAEAMFRVEAAGFRTVVHVHDEIVTEGDYSESHLKLFEQLMAEVPAWAKGFPIAAACWRSARYIKG
jgi:DNA polymerase bacteriophage-type